MNKVFHKNLVWWFLLVVVCVSVIIFIGEFSRDKMAKIIFLDVGQGDATLIIASNGRQVLIDAGKYPSIGNSLSKYMPRSDRSIDMVIATHPDIDHIAGFDSLLDEYEIDYFIHSGLLAGESVYKKIADKVREQGIQTLTAQSGQKIILDKNMYLEILVPYQNQKIENPNDHSIIIQLVVGDSSVILTGDASKLVEQNLVSVYGDRLQSNILKIGHHGSKTSTDDIFVKTVNPQYGVISAGCNNQFGHPHATVLRTLDENQVRELNTCDEGDIIFEFQEGDWVFKK